MKKVELLNHDGTKRKVSQIFNDLGLLPIQTITLRDALGGALSNVSIPLEFLQKDYLLKRVRRALKDQEKSLYFTVKKGRTVVYSDANVKVMSVSLRHRTKQEIGQDGRGATVYDEPVGLKKIPIVPSGCVGYEVVSEASYLDPSDRVIFYVKK